MTRNTFKAALARGEQQIGLWLSGQLHFFKCVQDRRDSAREIRFYIAIARTKGPSLAHELVDRCGERLLAVAVRFQY